MLLHGWKPVQVETRWPWVQAVLTRLGLPTERLGSVEFAESKAVFSFEDVMTGQKFFMMKDVLETICVETNRLEFIAGLRISDDSGIFMEIGQK